MPEVAPQTLVDGRYRVLDRLGSGGMADVFCAEDVQLGRKVALKLLHRRFAAADAFVERFRREAQSAAGLQHPNVVGVFDRGEWDGTSYIAMEYLPGRTLKQLITAEAPLDPVRAIDITAQILKATRFAHRRGVIHRDLKPHNVIVDDEDRVKVTDFGIARAGASDMTETGSILGTAGYLSPEQAQGLAVSERSDLYSIGVILYELLTGRLPFEADSAVAIAVKHVHETPPPPSQVNAAVPPELDRIVLWALEKDPARRPADADAFLAALEDVRAQLAKPRGSHTSSWAAVAGPAVLEEERGRRWRWLVLLLLLLLLAGGGGAAYLLTRPDVVRVPRVVGETFAVAQTRLQNDGFEVNVIRRTSDRPRDRVIGQTPLAGEEIRKGSTVSLTVSDGPAQGTIPDVTGEALDAARRRVRRAGFRVRVARAASETIAAGRVSAVSPDPGVRLDRGSVVTLTVSTGPALVTLPDVVGQDAGSARATLEAQGFSASVVEQESSRTVGTVLAQTPAGGTAVRRGTPVALTVAKQALVAVPNVVGRGADAAVNALSAAGFSPRVQRRTVSRVDQDGKVLAQSPAGGQAPRGASVTVVIGRFQPQLTPNEQPNQGGGSNNQTTTPDNQTTTPGNQTTTPGNQTTTPGGGSGSVGGGAPAPGGGNGSGGTTGGTAPSTP